MNRSNKKTARIRTALSLLSALWICLAIMLLLPFTAQAAAPTVLEAPTTGFVSWWAGDGTANDSQGANNGTLQGSAGYAAGHAGQAFSFDGSGYVTVPDAASLHVGQFSISLWFNWSNQGTDSIEFLTSKGVGQFEIQTGGTTNNLRFIPAGHPATTVDAPNAIQPGWNHLVVTYIGAEADIYLNGALAASRTGITGGADLNADTSPLVIGRRADASYPYHGAIDEIKLFNRALDSSEVSGLYHTVSAGVVSGLTGATLNGAVNDNGLDTTVAFEYGTTTAYGFSVAATPAPVTAGSGLTMVAATLSGLDACGATTYHYRLKATNASGATYGVDHPFTTLQCQTISFTAIPDMVTGTSATASATATSGLPVVFSSLTPLTCGVSGATVTGIAIGGCTIAADQPGNGMYAAASQVTQSFTIGKGNHDLAFGPAPAIVVGGTGTVSAGDASGMAVLFSSLTPAVCTVSGAIVTGAAAGVCTIAANLPGDSNYYAAGQVTQSFAINASDAALVTTLKATGVLMSAPYRYGSSSALSYPSTAILNGTVTAAAGDTCLVSFEYGTTTAYGSVAPVGSVGGGSTIPVSATAPFSWSDRSPSEDPVRHYRVKAVCNGGTRYGNDIAFVPLDSPPAANIVITATCSDDATMANYDILNYNSFDVTFDYTSGVAYRGTVIVGSNQVQQIFVAKGGITSFFYNTTLFSQVATNDQLCSATPDPSTQIQVYARGTTAGRAAIYSLSRVGYLVTTSTPVSIIAGSDQFDATAPAGSEFGWAPPGRYVRGGSNSIQPQYIATEIAEAQVSYNGTPFNIASPAYAFPWAPIYVVSAAPVSSTPTTALFQLQNNDDAPHTVVLRSAAGTEHRYTLPAYVAQQVTVPYDTWGLYLVIPGMVGPKMVGDHILVGTLYPALVDQTITFGPDPSVAVGGTGTVSATGGLSGNPVTFTSLTTDVCTTSGANGATVTGQAVGSCTIAANQAGSGSYAAAQQVTRSIAILHNPAITSAASAGFAYGTAGSFTVTTIGSPTPALTRTGVLPLGVVFRDNGDGTATIFGTPNAAGTFTITITAASSSGSASQGFTLTVEAAAGPLSAVDGSISLSPDRYLFGVVTLGGCGDTIPFTVRNIGSGNVTLGDVGTGGVDAGQYAIAGDTCSGQTLAAGATCTVGVEFCPQSIGSKAAQLQVPHDGVTLAAFLHNYESVAEEAGRRMPPVLSQLAIPAEMHAGQQYTITWSLLGYDDDYLSRVVFFDCAGTSDGNCGDSFGSNFADSGNLPATATDTGDWIYNGVVSTRFDYSYTFTAPAAATDIVIRFYRKTAADDAAGKGSLSLLIPGNVVQTGTSYYDSDGRRVVHGILP